MNEPKSHPIRSFLRFVWLTIDWSRRLLINAIFLFVLALFLIVALSDDRPRIHDDSALVLRVQGTLVEELSTDELTRAVAASLGQGPAETRLGDLKQAVLSATGDDRIQALVLDLRAFGGGGLPQLQELGEYLQRFRDSGKTIVAYADTYGQGSYRLAAHANEIYLHPFGAAQLPGFGGEVAFYARALEKLGGRPNVFVVGEFKSAVEPYTRSGLSPAARENLRQYVDQLWQQYLADIVRLRGIERAELLEYTNRYDRHLDLADGDAATAATRLGLIDVVGTWETLSGRVRELLGEEATARDFRSVNHATYLRDMTVEVPRFFKKPAVGVVVAQGVILPGEQPPGMVGGDTTSALLRQAAADDSIQAVVLRIDSPGGSQLASEQIRIALDEVRRMGKPVVASMGTVAASGGYWIALGADEIWAHPTTITGSIGIFSVLPTFESGLEKIGVDFDRVTTTPYRGYSPFTDLGDADRRVFQIQVERGYRDFVGLVAEARQLAPEAVESAAQGRVWIGREAQELRLVDHLGSLDEAIASAAHRAGIGDRYRSETLERLDSFSQRLARALSAKTLRLLGLAERRAPSRNPLVRARELLQRELEALSRLYDPFDLYAYCPFCRAP